MSPEVPFSLFYMGPISPTLRGLPPPAHLPSSTPPHLQIWLCRNLLWLGLLLGGRVRRGCRVRSMWVVAPLTKAHSSRGLGSETAGTAGTPGCMARRQRSFSTIFWLLRKELLTQRREEQPGLGAQGWGAKQTGEERGPLGGAGQLWRGGRALVGGGSGRGN